MKPLSLIALLTCFAIIANAQTITLNVHQPDPLDAILSANSFNILFGDTLILGEELNITGGTPPYQIEWTNSITGDDSICNLLSIAPTDTTTYTCTVIDSTGCSLSQYIQVNVIFPLEIDIIKQDISCYGANDGYIALNISGGSQPYYVKWGNDETSNEINGLVPGEYSVTITDAFNQKVDTTITVIELPQITTSVSQTICANQSYFFNERELKEAGEYIDTLSTVSGCDSVVTLTLSINQTYQSSFDAQICSDENYTFQGKELNTTGQYTDSLISMSGCDSLIICNLIVNSLPEKPVITINGDTLTSSEAQSYQWYKNDVMLNGQIDQTLIITEAGNYSVEVTNESGCTNQSDNYNITYTAIAEFLSPDFNFKVFPNPNNGLFTVEIESAKPEPIELKLYSVDGKLILQKTLNAGSGKQSIPFGNSNLIKGIYTLQIQKGTNAIHKKLIID